MRGHAVFCSTNGQEAVDLVQKDRQFDCILMVCFIAAIVGLILSDQSIVWSSMQDIQMPILDGFGAAEKIREIEKADPLAEEAKRVSTSLNNGIPIIAVSASLKESQRTFMMEKGMDGWILKPIDFERLHTLKHGILDVEQRRKDLYVKGCDWEKGGWMRAAS